MAEVWKPVLDYENTYAVSDMGHIKRIAPGSSTYAGRIIKPVVNKRGYCQVNLHRDGKAKKMSVHALVLEAFAKPRPRGREANHKNGNKSDNRIQNLEWVTPKENVRHAIDKLGRPSTPGESNVVSKLVKEQVIEIRRLYLTGNHTQTELSSLFGVCRSAISHIVTRRNWKHI